MVAGVGDLPAAVPGVVRGVGAHRGRPLRPGLLPLRLLLCSGAASLLQPLHRGRGRPPPGMIDKTKC